jgi:hypothetical protein
MRPSFTMISNSDGEIPMYAAAATRDSSRGGSEGGRISGRRHRHIALTRVGESARLRTRWGEARSVSNLPRHGSLHLRKRLPPLAFGIGRVPIDFLIAASHMAGESVEGRFVHKELGRSFRAKGHPGVQKGLVQRQLGRAGVADLPYIYSMNEGPHGNPTPQTVRRS